MQTNSIKGKSIGVGSAIAEMLTDMKAFGLKGVFRGQVNFVSILFAIIQSN